MLAGSGLTVRPGFSFCDQDQVVSSWTVPPVVVARRSPVLTSVCWLALTAAPKNVVLVRGWSV